VGNCQGQGVYVTGGLGEQLPRCDHGVKLENPPCHGWSWWAIVRVKVSIWHRVLAGSCLGAEIVRVPLFCATMRCKIKNPPSQWILAVHSQNPSVYFTGVLGGQLPGWDIVHGRAGFETLVWAWSKKGNPFMSRTYHWVWKYNSWWAITSGWDGSLRTVRRHSVTIQD